MDHETKKHGKSFKKELGQFFTTNYSYILQDMEIPDKITNIIEPFAGNGDLVKFVEEDQEKKNVLYRIECYDVDPKNPSIMRRDTLKDPPCYTDKFVITNPPYLARNKSRDKTIFDKYNVNDLYKCLMKHISQNVCLGGILIVPLNFWSSIRVADRQLRKSFLEKYDVVVLNIFEENVFDDTSYTVCSFQFTLKMKRKDNVKIKIMVYPSKKYIETELNEKNNFMIGGDIYNFKSKNSYSISRLTSKNLNRSNTNILAKCIDDNLRSPIALSFVRDEDIYVDTTPNQTARTYATLIIDPPIDKEKQKELISKFNKYLGEHRNKYNSLFLTNYRESKDIARKRISFDLVYSIIKYILDDDM